MRTWIRHKMAHNRTALCDDLGMTMCWSGSVTVLFFLLSCVDWLKLHSDFSTQSRPVCPSHATESFDGSGVSGESGSDTQVSRKEKPAATLHVQRHQHVHLLAANSPDNDLRYSHKGKTDFAFGSWQGTTESNICVHAYCRFSGSPQGSSAQRDLTAWQK